MKISLAFLLALVSLSANAQSTAQDKRDSECAAKVATYVDGLETGYEQVKNDVAAQQLLHTAKLAQKNMTPCAAEEFLFQNAKSAVKAGDSAVAEKVKNKSLNEAE
jgi:hypothetical protein